MNICESVEDAERYADADKKRRDDAENPNAADGSCYEAEKQLANFADKLTDELKKRLEAALRETKEALLKKDVVLATDRAETLKKILKETGATRYTQTGQAEKGGPSAETRWQGASAQPHGGAAGAQASSSGDAPQGKVMDAEYQENKQK
ncbi:MAG: Hsp70 family protein [Acidovorax sp.]